jgi:hypothetical protein
MDCARNTAYKLQPKLSDNFTTFKGKIEKGLYPLSMRKLLTADGREACPLL